jgi:FdhD protein
MGAILNREVIHGCKNASVAADQYLLVEEPLSIRVQNKPYSIIMRTPGDEIPHAAGFCLAEGIVDRRDDFLTINYCDEMDQNTVNVVVKQSRYDEIPHILKRRGFISQTSCGVCGKEVVNDLYQTIKPLRGSGQIDIEMALECVRELPGYQSIGHDTRSSHAAALYDSTYNLLSVAEDIGRHNALDKATGELFLEQRLHDASLIILSSRISYELVQKAGRARVSAILAISRPTSLAVELAEKLNIAVACLAREGGLYIYCGEHRFKGKGEGI